MGLEFSWTSEKRDRLKVVSYASIVGSLKYAMLCAKPNICFAIVDIGTVHDYNLGWMLSIYSSTFGEQLKCS